MKIFQKVQISQRNEMSKKDRKRFAKDILEQFQLEIAAENLIVSKYKNRFFIVSDSEKPLFFNLKNFYYPTINFLSVEENIQNIKIPRIVLDKNARRPIIGGADVMARGIYVNFDLCDDFKKDDIVYVKIGEEIIAVGKTLYPKNEIKEDLNGEAVEIYHVLNDDLHSNCF